MNFCRYAPAALLLATIFVSAGCRRQETEAVPFDDAAPAGKHSVVINEVSSTGDDAIELLNTSEQPISIGGWQVMDSKRNLEKRYVLPADSVLPPGVHLVLRRGTHHDFGLGGEDAVFLEDDDGNPIDSTVWEKGQATLSFCRIPNGSGAFTTCPRTTWATSNSNATPADVVIVKPLWIAGGDGTSHVGPPLMEIDELCFDAEGRLWVPDIQTSTIHIYDPDGKYLGAAGSQGSGVGQFQRVGTIRADSQGRVYALDRTRRILQVFAADTRAAVASIDVSQVKNPMGLAITSQGDFLIGDMEPSEGEPDRIARLSSTGILLSFFQDTVDGQPIFRKFETLAVDEASDRVFATSEFASRVEVFALSTGLYRKAFIGSRQTGEHPQPGRIKKAVEGIAVDAENNRFFLVDEANGRILVHALRDQPALYDERENFAFVGAFGSIGAEPGWFNSVDGLAIDSAREHLAVSDDGNHRIQVFALSDIAKVIGLESKTSNSR